MKYLLFVLCGLFLLESCDTENSTHQSTAEEISYHQEMYRPQFHFSPEANWMNDPNGMVYYEGEYHLFYQYYPDSTVWGPMHWAHAVSPDMVSWTYLPIALYPDSLGYIFSGSAVIDWNNSSELGVGSNPPMIAIFTHHNMEKEKAGGDQFQYQSIAYSNDKGRTWTKYTQNPVVANPGIRDFRDPKVIWHEESQRWVMVFAAYDKVRIYHSPNLKDWIFASEFGIPGDTRLWECPDLFPLKIAGTDETKWILITSIQQEGPNGGTATSYFIGDFDGATFTANNQEQHWLDYGRDNYALVSWSDVPKTDGRRLALGWMSNWQYAQVVPTQKWRSAMTLPRELILENTTDGLRLRSVPVKELVKLRKTTEAIAAKSLKAGENFSIPLENPLLELQLPISEYSSDAELALVFSNEIGELYEIGFDATSNRYYSDRTKAGISDFSEVFAKKHWAPKTTSEIAIDLHLYLDLASAELFLDQGATAITDIFFPQKPYTTLDIQVRKGKVTWKEGQLYGLKTIWQ